MLLLYYIFVTLLRKHFSEAYPQTVPTNSWQYSDVCYYCGCATTTETTDDGVAVMEFPWMALLIYKSNNSLDYPCGGTLINERYVLTSAQCATKDDLIKVRLGKHTKSKDCGEQATKECSQPPQQDFTVEHVSIHYDYNRTTLANDIALLRLTSTVNTHGFRRPVCLPIVANPLGSLNGKYALSTEWRVTEKGEHQLLENLLPIKNIGFCRRAYDGPLFRRRQLCAGGKGSKSLCRGGNGGPLMISNGPRFIQYGILSYGPKLSCRKQRPRVYTRVEFYLKWIIDNFEL